MYDYDALANKLYFSKEEINIKLLWAWMSLHQPVLQMRYFYNKNNFFEIEIFWKITDIYILSANSEQK